MRRAGGLWPRVVAFENLRRAALRAARGKRRVAGVARFLRELEPELFELQRALESDAWRPGRSFRFEIHDPKRRTITAAPFGDRVVHHALIDVLEPVLERRMVHESFACRRGKGTHRAVEHARALVRRYAFFLKLDVKKCFESLEHAVVVRALERVVKDVRVLLLTRRIVEAGGTGGVGLPIGNLTSQRLANLALDRLDHFVKEELGVRGYVRYMDDCALFGESKAELRELHAAVERFLAENLRLALKERATILAPCAQGLPFLGWRIYPKLTRPRPENLRRIRARMRHRAWELRTGRIGDECFVASMRAVCEHLRHGDTLSLRRRLFEGWSEHADARSPPGRRRGSGSLAPRTASTGAGRSLTTPRTRARRTATTGTRRTATRTSASAPPRHRNARSR